MVGTFHQLVNNTKPFLSFCKRRNPNPFSLTNQLPARLAATTAKVDSSGLYLIVFGGAVVVGTIISIDHDDEENDHELECDHGVVSPVAVMQHGDFGKW